jgi:hypothetical protein
MDSGFLALASGPALLVVYYLNMKRLPATFPHWVFISNGFFCYLIGLVVFVY